ncbi:hypothetical protein NE237_018487 [Protea cynaroides]|uniref:MADS-box domain-containing protein n=1 Tax=Protea cynaroides TaxID=273540 RepID=A0A9Q0K9Y2_9MAGN|nr:hypothetical protein NE237_018487 [Protea cynaroides]
MTIKNSAEVSDRKKEKNQAVSLKNRTKGLKKKLYELTTLCGIQGFMIILPDPQQVEGQSSSVEPIIWPENQHEVLGLIKRFSSTDNRKRRNCCNSDSRLKEDQKGAFSLEQGRPEKKSKICHEEGNRIDGFSLEELQELKMNIDSKISDLSVKIDLLIGKQREVLETEEVRDSVHQIMPLTARSSSNLSTDSTHGSQGFMPLTTSDFDGITQCPAMDVGPLNWLHQEPDTVFNSVPPTTSRNFDMAGSDGFSHCPAMDVGALNWLHQGPEMVFNCVPPPTSRDFDTNAFDGFSHCPAMDVGALDWLHQGPEMVFNCVPPTTSRDFDTNAFDGFSHCPAPDVGPLNWLHQGPDMVFDSVPPTTSRNFDMAGFDGFSHCPATDVGAHNWLHQGPELVFNCIPPTTSRDFDTHAFDGFSHCPAMDVGPPNWLHQGHEMVFNCAPLTTTTTNFDMNDFDGLNNCLGSGCGSLHSLQLDSSKASNPEHPKRLNAEQPFRIHLVFGVFALSPTEVGSVLSLGTNDSCEFFHDPSMKTSLAGQVRKSLSVVPPISCTSRWWWLFLYSEFQRDRVRNTSDEPRLLSSIRILENLKQRVEDKNAYLVAIKIDLLIGKQREVLETEEVRDSVHQVMPLTARSSSYLSTYSTHGSQGFMPLKTNDFDGITQCPAMDVGPLNWLHQGPDTVFNSVPPTTSRNEGWPDGFSHALQWSRAPTGFTRAERCSTVFPQPPQENEADGSATARNGCWSPELGSSRADMGSTLFPQPPQKYMAGLMDQPLPCNGFVPQLAIKGRMGSTVFPNHLQRF